MMCKQTVQIKVVKFNTHFNLPASSAGRWLEALSSRCLSIRCCWYSTSTFRLQRCDSTYWIHEKKRPYKSDGMNGSITSLEQNILLISLHIWSQWNSKKYPARFIWETDHYFSALYYSQLLSAHLRQYLVFWSISVRLCRERQISVLSTGKKNKKKNWFHSDKMHKSRNKSKWKYILNDSVWRQ